MIIYYLPKDDDFTPGNILHLSNWMPHQQQEAIAKIKNSTGRMDQIVAYTMLCHALKKDRSGIHSSVPTIKQFATSGLTNRYLKTDPPLFHFGDHGKPYLTNYEGIYFNISHCREAVVVGVSSKEVGIDAEGSRSFSESLLQRAFNDDEQSRILSASVPEREFARLWTRKEAWFKWTGTGILINHIQETEAEASKAGCSIVTTEVVPSDQRKRFFLSIASQR